MTALSNLLLLAHLVGLALAVGAASVKLVLLIHCARDLTLVPAYLSVVRPVTKMIILGLILLTLSGLGWLLQGHRITALLAGKLLLVAAIWVLGPIIDKVVEARFVSLRPREGEEASAEFLHARKRYVTFELVATSLFYVIIVMWTLG